LENAADIGILQAERHLDPKESEGDIPQAPKALTRLVHTIPSYNPTPSAWQSAVAQTILVNTYK
jgi:hypothetical protein